MTSNNSLDPVIFQFTVGNLLIYPMLTVQRRLECQVNLPGMIPKRYNGFVHGFSLIAKEEGIRGLYRGFLGFNLVVSNIKINTAIAILAYLNQNNERLHGQTIIYDKKPSVKSSKIYFKLITNF